jgi:hypothetical protein
MSDNDPASQYPYKWNVDLKVPPTTLWLPVFSDLTARDIAKKAATKVYGEEAAKERIHELARIIKIGVDDFRERRVKKGGLIFFPDYNRLPPVATIDVTGYRPEDSKDVSSLEHYREVYGTPDKHTASPISVAEIDLPTGPALRFHNRYYTVNGLLPVPKLQEHVTYVVCPPVLRDAVVLTVAWAEFKFSEALINMADAIAPTLEIKVRDA